MGRDKARLRFGPRSLLGQVRAAARKSGWPARVIRKDLVTRCGPLGGVYTALKTSPADIELFLACDMPFVTPALLEKLLRNLGRTRQAVFATLDGTAGFPFLVRARALPIVERQIRQKRYSIQALALALRARLVWLPRRYEMELCNVNTREEWERARKWLETSDGTTDRRLRADKAVRAPGL